MHKNATKCNETLSKWCENKHGASKIMDTLETYQRVSIDEIQAASSVHEHFLGSKTSYLRFED
jgi:hypothetical protein